jgi:hypothetical protein
MNARLTINRLTIALLLTCAAPSVVCAQPDHSGSRRLVDPQLDEDQRASMVAQLLRSNTTIELQEAIEQSPRTLAGVVLEQVLALESTERTGEMFQLVIRATSFDPPTHLDGAMAIVSEHHQRDAIRVCISLLDHEDIASSASLTGQIMDTLVIQTGQTSMERDPKRWKQWWSLVEWLPEVQWLKLLVEAHAQRGQEATGTIARQRLEMIDLYSKVYAQSNDTQRETLVSEMLVDEHPQLRLAGLDLIERGVVNGRPPQEQVQNILVELLRDPIARVRARAAVVGARSLNRAPGQTLTESLSQEADESVALELISLVARWPSPDNIDAVWRWVDNPATRSRCVETLTSALLAGVLDTPVARQRARDVIENVQWSSPSSAEVRLAGALADQRVLERVCASIPSMSGVTRIEAIRVVLRHAVLSEQLAQACAQDETILVRVRDELKTMHPDAQGLRVLLLCCRAVEPSNATQTSTQIVMGFLRGFPEQTQRALIDSQTTQETQTAIWDESLRRQLNASLQALESEADDESTLDGTS